MKKLFFLSAITIYFFTLLSCNGSNSKTEASVVDSLKKDSALVTTTDCAPGDSSTIEYWKIDSATAIGMILNVVNPQGKRSQPKYKRDNIDKLIKDSFKGNYIGAVSARYRSDDVERYRTKRCIAISDSAGMVDTYFTYIIKVKKKKERKLNDDLGNYDYFDFYSIHPPPNTDEKIIKQ